MKQFDPEEEFEEVTEELWQYVYERDNGLCQVYGGAGEHTHHAVYKSQGGKNKANNLILLSEKAHLAEEHGKTPRGSDYYLRKIVKNEKRFRERMV